MLSNTWLLEVLAISFSVMSLVAIAAVLLVYDGQRDPQLRYGITLNAVISLLATASKSSLLCSVAGMMAQLKWEWFNKERKLFDIQSFDQASRGPAGSIALLCGRASRSLASLGAFIVILALLFDAFIQQLITYPLRDTVEYNTTAIHRKASIFVIDPNSTPFISAMNRGAWSEATQYNRSSTCPSGHCTWPVYESIGWCSRCVNALPYAKLHGSCDWRSIRNGSTYVGNATHHLQDMCKLTLGPGKDVTIMQAAQDKVVTVRKAAWTVDALEFALYKNPSEAVAQVDNVALGIRGPALTLGYATVDYGVYQGPRVRPSQSLLSNFTKATVTSAEECVLTPCLRKYNTTVEAGIESANVLSINYGRTQYQNTTSILAGIRRYVQPITCWQPNSDKVTYVLVGEAFVKGPDSGQYFPFLANVTQKAFCPVPVYGYTVGDFLTRNALASQLLTFPKGHAQGYWHSMDHSDVMCGREYRCVPHGPWARLEQRNRVRQCYNHASVRLRPMGLVCLAHSPGTCGNRLGHLNRHSNAQPEVSSVEVVLAAFAVSRP